MTDPRSFPERFADALFERYPDWRSYVATPDPQWQSEDDLAVRVPSRFAPHCPLCVDTTDDGIIVSWIAWHTHCDAWVGGQPSEEEFVAKAFEVIDGIITEKLAVIFDWKSDGPSGMGSSCPVGELDKELRRGWWARVASERTVVVISWNGTHDCGEFDPARC